MPEIWKGTFLSPRPKMPPCFALPAHASIFSPREPNRRQYGRATKKQPAEGEAHIPALLFYHAKQTGNFASPRQLSVIKAHAASAIKDA